MLFNRSTKRSKSSHVVLIPIAIVLSLLIALFGVYVSLFSDGSEYERLITQIVIVALYAALSFGFGSFNPKLSWKWGAILTAPGLLVYAYLVAYDPPLLKYLWFPIAFFGASVLCAAIPAVFLKNKLKNKNVSGKDAKGSKSSGESSSKSKKKRKK